jgi:hypothetical protein
LMPRGPKGEKRPADVIGAAVMVGRIATGEIEDRPATPESEGKNPAAEPYGPRGDDTPPRRGTVPNVPSRSPPVSRFRQTSEFRALACEQ